jgi:single-strand DNA-binding protein
VKTLNRVTLLGNLVRDPELKSTTGGQSVCTFGLATNRTWKDAGGNDQSLPEFHTVVCWGKLAELAAQALKKGKAVYVEGYLKTRDWSDPESGKKLYRTEIIVENLILLSPREATEQADPAPEEAPL